MGRRDKMGTMNKLLIGMILLLAVVPVASAQVSNFGSFKQYECITLLQICDSCTTNTITSVLYPNSTQALGITVMTPIGTEYNATFCKTGIIGTYIVNGFGDLGGVDTTWNYVFDVTATGNENTTFTFMIIGISALVIILLAYLMKNEYLAFISGAVFFLLGVYTEIFGFNGANDVYTQGMGMVAIGLGLFFTIASAYNLVEGNEGGDYVIED
jgi:hypothetical protein